MMLGFKKHMVCVNTENMIFCPRRHELDLIGFVVKKGKKENMKILVVSDSHGSNAWLNKALEQAGTVDYFIHLGDLEGCEHFIEAFVSCEKYLLSGNNDYYLEYEQEGTLELQGKRFFMAHGHQYEVYMGVEKILEEGKCQGADVVLFGHTHKPYLENREGVLILNPGSISLPRQKDRIPTYAIMEIKETGEVDAEIFSVKL